MPILSQTSLQAGMIKDDAVTDFITVDQLANASDVSGNGLAIVCENDDDLGRLPSYFDRIACIGLRMPHFSDGRAFSQAQRLRHWGFRGTVRVLGHIIPDQWRHAVCCGVDEVDISEELLHRTTLQAWVNSALWQGYQQRLKQRVSA